MKKYFGALGILGCVLLGSTAAQATPGWVQLPGAATQIAVGASDYPIILDTNGYIQYLGKATLACGSGICVQQPREWVFSQAQYADGWGVTKQQPTVRMTRVAADLMGRAWSLDTAGGLWVGWGNSTDGSILTQMTSGTAVCATSLAPGLMQSIPPEWNHVFPERIGFAHFDIVKQYSPTFITGCGSPSLLRTDFTFFGDMIYEADGVTGRSHFRLSSNGWQTWNDAELQVAWFTVPGLNTRIPWVQHRSSSGMVTAYAAINPGPWVAAPAPNGKPVTYITDHYVVADNHVWRWNGDPYGKRGNPVWVEIANSYPLAGSTIKEIAYSLAVKGTAEGASVGPSHLYMVDSANRIWQYGEIEAPPK